MNSGKMVKHFNVSLIQVVALLTLSTPCVIAQADEPFIGEVRWFAGNFAPRGWAMCNGQLLSISQYTPLFALLGTNYGGDGRTTFALPDLRGRGMVHAGTGQALSPRALGQSSGAETVTLTGASIPPHTHALRANDSGGDSVLPADRVLSSVGRLPLFDEPLSDVNMHETSIASIGDDGAHNNMQPYIALTCIIALEGSFPPRNNDMSGVKPGATVPITRPQPGRD